MAGTQWTRGRNDSDSDSLARQESILALTILGSEDMVSAVPNQQTSAAFLEPSLVFDQLYALFEHGPSGFTAVCRWIRIEIRFL